MPARRAFIALAAFALLSASLLSGQAQADGLTPGEWEATLNVFVGNARCDQKQEVYVDAVEDQPGQFTVQFKGRVEILQIQETSSGAVRLEDKKSGWLWIQIPAKSMLLDAQRGQRLADGCATPEQRELWDGAQVAPGTLLRPR